MTDAPEKIWAWRYKSYTPWSLSEPDHSICVHSAQYIRVDLADAAVAAAYERAAQYHDNGESTNV